MSGIGIITNPMFIILWLLVLMKEMAWISMNLVNISIFSIIVLGFLFLLSYSGM